MQIQKLLHDHVCTKQCTQREEKWRETNTKSNKLALALLLLLCWLLQLHPLPLSCQVCIKCCLQCRCVLPLCLVLPNQVLVALVQLPLPVA